MSKDKHPVHVSEAPRNKIISTSKFTQYDHCLNPYVGCAHGCTYCYVQFFMKGPTTWGHWVRVRRHMDRQLPRDLRDVTPTRLAIGTMTDPYQPIEEEERLTRRALEIVAEYEMTSVGIFTRSPLILDDLELLQRVNATIHFTIAPIDPKYLEKLEPLTTEIEARWEAVEKLKSAGLKTCVNVAPALPIVSDDLAVEYCNKLAALQIDEFFVDPMQLYRESKNRVEMALYGHPRYQEIEVLLESRAGYAEWKGRMHESWVEAWQAVMDQSPNTRALAMDHENKVRIDMSNGDHLPWRDE